MSSVAPRVLNTAELLEAVLLEVPLRDVVRLQRVNKMFKATTEGSIHIQQKIFLQARPSGADGALRLNPCLLHVTDRIGLHCSSSITKYNDQKGEYTLSLNDIDRYMRSSKEYYLAKDDLISVGVYGVNCEIFPSKPWSASWKDMIIADSPLRIRVFAAINENNFRGSTNTWITIATLGDLVKACSKCYSKVPVPEYG